MILLFFRDLIDSKTEKIKLDVVLRTNEEYLSVTFGCMRFLDSFRFLSVSLDKLVKTLKADDSIF